MGIYWYSDYRDVIASVMCGATKTVAFGIPLINILFSGNPEIGIYSLPLLMYHALQLFAGSFMVVWFGVWRLDQRDL